MDKKKIVGFLLISLIGLSRLSLAQQVANSKIMVFLPENASQIPTISPTDEKEGLFRISQRNSNYTAVRLYFNLSMLPAGSKITGITFQLYKKGNNTDPSESSELTSYLGYLKKSEDDLLKSALPNTADDIVRNFPNKKHVISLYITLEKTQADTCTLYEVNFPLPKPHEFTDTMYNEATLEKRLSLLLYTHETGNSSLYSNLTENVNYRPRLCVHYTIPNHTFAANEYTQPYFNSQNTSQNSSWGANGAVEKYNLVKFQSFNPNHSIDGQPLLADNKIIIPLQELVGMNTGKNYLFAFSADQSARFLFKSDTLNNIAGIKFPIAIDSRNRVICVTRDREIKIFDLADHLKQIKVVPVIGFNKDASQQITAPPLVGSDGSLYISTRRGLFAFTPDYQLKWQLLLNHNFSMPVLSVDESKAYVIDPIKEKLLTINNTNGKIENRDGQFNITLAENSGINNLPVPVVDPISHMVICLNTAKKNNDKDALLFFKPDGSLVKHFSAGNELISQPVCSNGAIYVIHHHRLAKYNIKIASGADNAIHYIITSDFISSPNVNLSSETTDLIANESGNKFAFDVSGTRRKLIVFDREDHIFCEQPIPDSLLAKVTGESGQNFRNNRFSITSDDGLYAANSNTLFWFNPSKIKEIGLNDTLRGNIENKKVYRSDKPMMFAQPIEIKKGAHVQIQNTLKVDFAGSLIVEKGAQFKVGSGLKTDLFVDTAGNVGIGTSSPRASFEVYNANSGVTLPRMSQRNILDILSPIEGSIIFNSTTGRPVFFNGTRWLYFDGTAMNYRKNDLLNNGKIIEITDKYGEHGKIESLKQSDGIVSF